MNTMSSGEFRKTYANLKEPVIVTVNGHPIGVWSPRTVSPDGLNVWPSDKLMAESRTNASDEWPPDPPPAALWGDTAERFNTQPFRGPIPKKR